ncbi:MAG: hypothetical protein RLN88_13765 [Ekhidna sp.]|uniref:hypothetical protein n=1 Tax=Ekhidna sp. TaxID=2608089 RepID=UPI0032ECB572
MKKIYLILSLTIASLLLFSCDDENLFDTVEADPPSVTATGWTATAIDGGGNTVYSTGFADGGRLFRLPGPNDDSTSTVYRDINVQALFDSGDERTIDSITVWMSWIPSFPSNSPQAWTVYEGISIPPVDRASSYQFDYSYNLDTWMDDYVCFNFITGVPGGCGAVTWSSVGPAFGLTITREDNMMRTTLHFSDGTQATIAQVQFSLPRLPSGVI